MINIRNINANIKIKIPNITRNMILNKSCIYLCFDLNNGYRDIAVARIIHNSPKVIFHL